jgi:uncharacterized protein YfkK (UPF0435 family)
MTPTNRLNPMNNIMLSSEMRDGRFVSLNYPEKKSPLPSRRDDERYLGVDPIQLEKIKRKIHQNEGVLSPKYNVRYFKESNDIHQMERERRNLSVGAPQSRLIVHKGK